MLAQRLDALGIEGQIFLLGGAALALGYYEEGERRLTADVDAWFTPPGAVSAAAEVLATEMHVPADWLNDKAVIFVPPHGLPEGISLLRHGGMAIDLAPPGLLLAMKLRAARVGRDNDDIAILLRRCGVRSVVGAQAVLDEWYDGEELLTAKARAIIEVALGDYPVRSAIPPFTLPAVDAGDSHP